jgi:aryl sulfotransferase
MNQMASGAAEYNSQDSSIRQNASPQEAYAVLCHARDATARSLNARLSAAGFDDIQEDALLIFYAMHLNGAGARALIRRLGINGQAASQSIETLILRGYLEFRDNPDDPRQPTVVMTERGRAALLETEAGLKADRWAQFPFRSGDIVISTEPKSGTTWVQMICALLIFQTPSLPASLPELSPWLDERGGRCAKIYAELAAQQHRRFIKTHVPLNDIPTDPRVTYIVVARNPLDIAVSWHHQISDLIPTDNAGRPSGNERPPETARQWVLDRIDEMGTSPHGHDSYFDTVLKSLSCAWERRAEPNVVLVHYEDLSADLPGEMCRLARRLDITVPEDKWPSLVQAATFKQMKAAAEQLQPLQYARTRDVSKGHAAFFRRGSSGDGRALLTGAEAARYYTRAAQVAPDELLAWLQRDDGRLCDLMEDPVQTASMDLAGPLARSSLAGVAIYSQAHSSRPDPCRGRGTLCTASKCSWGELFSRIWLYVSSVRSTNLSIE